MKILIAEDDLVARRGLETTLIRWGHEVIATRDGWEAWAVLQQPDAPLLAFLDWMMPGMDGIDVCRKVRDMDLSIPTYIILLTVKSTMEDVVTGLNAGADDYLIKPFDRDELRARLQVGVRYVEMQMKSAEHLTQLESALAQVKLLQGIVPICSYCKKIRDDQNYWQQIEKYVSEHSEAKFSHSICPDCYETNMKSQLDELKQSRNSPRSES